MSARLWRCARCGKWSHAKWRPRQHQRVLIDQAPAATDVVLADEYMPGYGEAGRRAVTITCGPFDAWTATRDDVQ